MRKFFGLIINEYVKILCKVSTKIMLAVIIIVALCYNALLNLGANIMMNQSYSYHEGPDEMIARAQAEQYEGWERDVEMYTYAKENNIDMVYSYPDNNSAESWRRDAVYYMFNTKDLLKESGNNADLEKCIKDIDAAIKNKDWKAYYRASLSSLEILSSINGEYGQTDVNAIQVWNWQYKIDNDIAPASWKNILVDEITQNKQSLLNYANVTEFDDGYGEKAEILNKLAIAEYRLEKNIEHYTYDGIESMGNIQSIGFWTIFATSSGTISIISVLIIVVAGSLLSSEFSAGTVKFLLINPVKRWKIFAAKYASVLSITLIAVFALYIFNLLFAGIFFGFGNLGAPFLSAENGKIIVGSSLLYIAGKYLLGSVGMLCMATFAFAISSLVRNSALSIGLGVFLLFSGNLAVTILTALGFYQSKYILFANTDLNAVMNGTTGFINHTLAFALINIAVYMTVFILTAWDGFVRNDVK